MLIVLFVIDIITMGLIDNNKHNELLRVKNSNTQLDQVLSNLFLPGLQYTVGFIYSSDLLG